MNETPLNKIENLSEEEVAALNKALTIKLVKRTALAVGVVVVAHVGMTLLINRLENSEKSEQDD